MVKRLLIVAVLVGGMVGCDGGPTAPSRPGYCDRVTGQPSKQDATPPSGVNTKPAGPTAPNPEVVPSSCE